MNNFSFPILSVFQIIIFIILFNHISSIIKIWELFSLKHCIAKATYFCFCCAFLLLFNHAALAWDIKAIFSVCARTEFNFDWRHWACRLCETEFLLGRCSCDAFYVASTCALFTIRTGNSLGGLRKHYRWALWIVWNIFLRSTRF